MLFFAYNFIIKITRNERNSEKRATWWSLIPVGWPSSANGRKQKTCRNDGWPPAQRSKINKNRDETGKNLSGRSFLTIIEFWLFLGFMGDIFRYFGEYQIMDSLDRPKINSHFFQNEKKCHRYVLIFSKFFGLGMPIWDDATKVNYTIIPKITHVEKKSEFPAKLLSWSLELLQKLEVFRLHRQHFRPRGV